MKHYFNSLFNDNLTFILGWEIFVFLTTCFFLLIILRLVGILKGIEEIKKEQLKQTEIMQTILETRRYYDA